MFYDLVKVCKELVFSHTFNESNPDKGYFDTWKWRKLLINVVSVTYHTPKLAALSPLLKAISSKQDGLTISSQTDSQGRVTRITVTHNNKSVGFRFKR